MKTGYSVMDIMTNSPITVQKDLLVYEVAKDMKKDGVGSVLVMDGKTLLGIATEKDFLLKVIAEKKDPSKTKIFEIMTKKDDMVFINPNKDIYDAIVLMKEENVRRLPVMADGVLKGLITVNDILKIEPDLFEIMVERIDLREEERKLSFD